MKTKILNISLLALILFMLYDYYFSIEEVDFNNQKITLTAGEVLFVDNSISGIYDISSTNSCSEDYYYENLRLYDTNEISFKECDVILDGTRDDSNINSLNSGWYVVGRDIDSGTYKISSNTTEQTTIEITRDIGKKYDEFLDIKMDSTMELIDGDEIMIIGSYGNYKDLFTIEKV